MIIGRLRCWKETVHFAAFNETANIMLRPGVMVAGSMKTCTFEAEQEKSGQSGKTRQENTDKGTFTLRPLLIF